MKSLIISKSKSYFFVNLTQVLNLIASIVCNCCSTILEEEKLQQEERLRMEMRRQVTVSWDSGGPDEAPPKVKLRDVLITLIYLLVFPV